MHLVYRVISCDGLGGSIACTWNSQMAFSLSQIRVTCSTMKMSSFPLEIEKNIQAMKSYRFFQYQRTRDWRNPRRLPNVCFAQISPLLWSFSRFWSSFIRIEVQYRMKRNTLSCVSCIATVSINTYSLHSATILTRYRMLACILLRNKTLLFPKWCHKLTRPILHSVVNMEMCKIIHFESLQKINKNSYDDNFFAVVIRRKRKFILANNIFGG